MTDQITIWIYSCIVVLIAGYIRGYSGFGASMIIVIGLSFVFPVTKIVPVILILEVLASSYLLPRVYKEVDWRSLSVLLVGVGLGTPIGVYLLTAVPDRILRAAISVLIMIVIPLLWKGFALKKMPGTKATLATGAFSGLINGSAAIGGPPVVLFYFSSPKGNDISRASLIAFFLITDLIASGICLWNGLITQQTIFMVGLLIIPLVLGLAVGARSFFKTDPELFRKRVLGLLLVITLVTFFRSAYS